MDNYVKKYIDDGIEKTYIDVVNEVPMQYYINLPENKKPKQRKCYAKITKIEEPKKKYSKKDRTIIKQNLDEWKNTSYKHIEGII